MNTTKVGFALLTSSKNPAPSTRIACLNLFPHLAGLGLEPVVVFDQPEAKAEPDMDGVAERAAAQGCKVVVFQKIHGASVLRCITRLRELGIRSIYCVCDFVDNEQAAAVDRTIVVTDFLRSLYAPALQQRIDVVHDGIERPALMKPAPAKFASGRLRAVLVTSHEIYTLPVIGLPPRPWNVEVVGQFSADPTHRRQALRWAVMREARFAARCATLLAALHPRLERTPWHHERVYEAMLRADIGVIPVDAAERRLQPTAPVPSWQLKSENRLTLKMALGLPVIATPIPSYEPVLQHGVNGFFASTSDDWGRCFGLLRDPALRVEMGQEARQSVLARFSVERQAALFAASVKRARKVHLSE